VFARLSRAVEHAAGSPWAVGLAMALIVVWLATGPYFGWSDTWQLYANTFTTLVVFVLAFIIQASQVREMTALQAKLSELIRATEGARNSLIIAEELPDAVLAETVEELRQKATDGPERG
jgi:low affinity Fe/Cu permease